MNKFYFTFGSNHIGLPGTPEEGKSLFKKYVVILAENNQEARRAMFARYADKWSMNYTEEQFAGQPEAHGLTELETITA